MKITVSGVFRLLVPFLVAGAVLGFAGDRTHSDTSPDSSVIPEHTGELVSSDGKIYCYENGTALYMTGEYSGNYGYCYVPAFGAYGWVDVRFTY